MHHDSGACTTNVNTEIAITNGVHAIACDTLETEFIGNHLAINRKAGAGEGSRTKRQHVDAPSRISQTISVTTEHLEICQAPMGQKHRLRTLQVRIAGNSNVNVGLSQDNERSLRVVQICDELIDCLAQPDAQVSCNLIVTAASGVKLAAGIANQLD